MSARGGWLVRLYPVEWRERYGDELGALLEDLEPSSRRRRAAAALGLARGAAVQRLRYSGLVGDLRDRSTRVKAGLLAVMVAWAAFVVVGLAFAKFSESAPPAPAAFAWVEGLGVLVATLLLAGIAVAAPAATDALRRGAWPRIRRRAVVAAWCCGATVVAGVAIVGWAHQLTFAQRNGADRAYSVAAAAGALLVVASITALLRLGIALAHETTLGPRALRATAALAVAATLGMLAITVATLVWWATAAAASSASVPLAAGSGLASTMVGVATVMVAAVALSVVGSGRAVTALLGR